MSQSSTRLTPDDYRRHLAEESARFAAVLERADADAPVPTCPEWTAADLAWHLAEVQWFWARVIEHRPAAPDEDRPRPERPASYDDLLALVRSSTDDLAGRLAGLGAEEPAWSWAAWLPEGQTVGFTLRRQAHEALVHRLDAELTAGVDAAPVDVALAADGVAELFDVMYGGHPSPPATFTPRPGVVRIDLTDAGHRLFVQPGLLHDPESGESGPHLLLVDDPAVEPAAVVTAPAAALDAAWWNRGPLRPEVTGELAAYDAMREAMAQPLT